MSITFWVQLGISFISGITIILGAYFTIKYQIKIMNKELINMTKMFNHDISENRKIILEKVAEIKKEIENSKHISNNQYLENKTEIKEIKDNLKEYEKRADKCYDNCIHSNNSNKDIIASVSEIQLSAFESGIKELTMAFKNDIKDQMTINFKKIFDKLDIFNEFKGNVEARIVNLEKKN